MSNTTEYFDLDTLLANDTGRRTFTLFVKEFNNSTDNLLTLYLITSCFKKQPNSDRDQIKQILDKTYKTCIENKQLPRLSPDLKQKLCDSLKKSTYNEAVFNAVKKEIENLLTREYLPLYFQSRFFKEDFLKTVKSSNSTHFYSNVSDQAQQDDSKQHSKLQFDDILTNDSEHKQKTQQFAIPQSKSQKQQNIDHGSSRNLKSTKTSTSLSSAASYQQTQTAQPVTPSLITNKNSNKLNKTSAHISASSKSINNLNESTLSLNLKSNRLKLCSESSSSNHPPNPYHVLTKPLPVSCQDSEIQSIVSGDVHFDDQHGHYYSKTSRGHHSKLDKHMKQNLIANKNAKLNMPEFEPNLNPDEPSVPLKNVNGSKKPEIPTSQSDPKKFFEQVSSRLEQLILEQKVYDQSNEKPSKQRSLSNSNLPSNGKTINNTHLNDQNNIESNNSRNPLLYPMSQVDIIDTQLDEHLNRVYNNNQITNNSVNLINMSKASPKMCVKNSSDYSFNSNSHKNLNSKFNNLSINSTNQTLKQSTTKPQQHHFYQLISKSKEVDIDSQNHNNVYHENHLNHRGSEINSQDSGISTRSVASIERVNDWLVSSAQNNNKTNHENVHDDIKESKKLNEKSKTQFNESSSSSSSVKTTVAYYLPGEDLAYISTFNGKCLTLAQFKQLITKKGQFRYFFKTKSDLLDEECVVFQEATDDNSYVPMFNNKVIAKIEKFSNV